MRPAYGPLDGVVGASLPVVIVDNALYRRGQRVEVGCEAADLEEVRRACGPEGDFVWLGLLDPDAAEMERARSVFGLHPLAVEDALEAHQRPKMERYGDTVFVVLKTLWYVDDEDAVETGEIHLFVGPDFVVTIRHGEGTELHHARKDLESRPDVLAHGPGAVLWAVCDRVVDAYEEVVTELQTDVDEVEISVFSDARTRDSARIYRLKRELSEMRRAALPLREPMRKLAHAEVEGVVPAAAEYFRDVSDHLIRVVETIDALDNLLSTAFDAHLASISVQQNDDMRKISAGAALIVVPTLIAGVYGMNFDTMPELHWTYGYPYALTLMALSALVLWRLFKRSGWL